MKRLETDSQGFRVLPAGPNANAEGFTLIETLMAMFVLTFGLLAVGQMMYITLASSSLARSKGSAAVVAQNKIEYLAELYRRNPNNADLTLGAHGPEQVDIRNTREGTIMNRFNVEWTVAQVTDPRAGKTLSSRQVTVTVTPIATTGTTTNIIKSQNKVISVNAILSPRAL